MKHLLASCSSALIIRLAGTSGSEDATTLAELRILEAVAQLPRPYRQILSWQFGLNGRKIDVTAIADRLMLPVERVDRLLDQALVELGFVLLSYEQPDPAEAEAVAAACAAEWPGETDRHAGYSDQTGWQVAA